MIAKGTIVKRASLIAPRTTAITNTTTVTANLDCLGAAYAVIKLHFAIEINTNAVGPTISLLHSDDTTVTNFATIVADRASEDISTAGRFIVYEVDMRHRKRYLRLAVSSGTATNDNLTFGASSELWLNAAEPSSTTGRGEVVVIP